MKKRLEGRDEPILDPEIPIIDAHHHLFDRPTLRYMLEDYPGDAKAGHRIVASIYSETQAFMRREGPELLRAGWAKWSIGRCCKGFVGAPRADIEALVTAAVRFGDMKLATPDLTEAEINPARRADCGDRPGG